MSYRFPKLFFVSILMNIIMLAMLSGIAWYKREKIKTNSENFFASVIYKNDKSINSQKYEKEINSDKRYVAIGFDDFRDSDFSMVMPLLKKYKSTATFNRIAWDASPSAYELYRINRVFKNGHELGDHTWFHFNYIYGDALFNGQNPFCPDGSQIPFPSNEQMRNDYGSGKNAFGFELNTSIKEQNFGYEWELFDTTWENLTDEQCQQIRDFFSIYKDTTGKLELFDYLSNKYLGTTGNSFGSWNEIKQCYTGGIFTGAKTSRNHEIWERVAKITKLYYKDIYNSDFSFVTWSWPGNWRSPFKFEKDGKFYYDEECTRLFNYSAKFPSSIYADSGGGEAGLIFSDKTAI